MTVDKNKKEDKNNIDKEKQGLSEQAINHRETEGVDVNHQEKEHREKHQPRDNA